MIGQSAPRCSSTSRAGAASSARAAPSGLVKSGAPHSAKNRPRPATVSTASYSAGPTGVSAPAAAQAARTATWARSSRARSPRCRAAASTPTTPTTTAKGHMPCHIAQNHVSGTSSHGRLPVRAACHQACTARAVKA